MPEEQEELMRALHDEHASALWGYCFRLTGHDAARAQDVCQEALLRAWRHPDVLSRPPALARRWLFTVARNIAIDEWRSRQLRPEIVTNAPPEEADGQDRVDQMLEAWVLGEAMSRLSTDHREVLHECYLRGHSVTEAAARLGIPEGTVKSRTHYALRALRLALEELGVSPE